MAEAERQTPFTIASPSERYGESKMQKERDQKDPDLLQDMLTMLEEARRARETGDIPREMIWRDNWDAYWGRIDWTGKSEWQSKQWLPEVPNFVERFVASMRTAFSQTGYAAFTVEDPIDPKSTITDPVRRFTWALLDRSGTSPLGHEVSFAHTFADILKNGCMAAMSLAVGWRDGRVVAECVDPFEIYLDPTGRGRYRIRQFERDADQIAQMKDEKDEDGKPIWDTEVLDRLAHQRDEEGKENKERQSAGAQEIAAQGRKTLKLHEILYKKWGEDGTYQGRYLCVMANEREIIRGPEPNPFRHGEDWNVFAPLIRVGGSPYGRTYVESFASLAVTFIEFTNLVLDATNTNAMNAFMAWPGAMEDPTQLDKGIHPNVIFVANEEEEVAGKEFLRAVELGSLPAEAIAVWRQLKAQVNEAASQSEIAMGQLAPKSDTTATEVQASTQSQSVLINSIARDIEELVLDVTLRLIFYTGIQHFKPAQDEALAAELGPEISSMLFERKEEFLSRRFKFRFRGITGAIERARRLRGLLGFLNIVGGNPILAQAFLQRYSLTSLIDEMMRDFGIDPKRLEKSEQEVMMDSLQKLQQSAAQAQDPGSAAGLGGGGRGGAALAEPDPAASMLNMEAPT